MRTKSDLAVESIAFISVKVVLVCAAGRYRARACPVYDIADRVVGSRSEVSAWRTAGKRFVCCIGDGSAVVRSRSDSVVDSRICSLEKYSGTFHSNMGALGV